MKPLCKLLFAGLILFPLIPQLHAQPVITNQPASQTNLPGTTVSFNVAVNGTGPFTYQWQFNGNNLSPIITTVAGNGTNSYSGDGGAATNASFDQPYGVAFDATGNLYIADSANERIRKVGTNGIITTVAGNGYGAGLGYGSGGYSGDGGAATNASLDNPLGVAFDASGNLFIADTYTNRIRRVDSNGIITTVAGNGSFGYSGDGGAATNASMSYPSGVAFDASRNMYIADLQNNRIRKVDTNGIITTVAGNGYNAPYNGGYSGDGGAATNAELFYPSGVAVDATGNLFIADFWNSRIRKVDTNGIITTVAGKSASGYSGDGGAATNASLYLPSGVAFDAFGNLYFSDEDNNRIRKVDTNGIITTVAGNGSATYAGDGGAATNASLYYPEGVALDAFGNLYIADNDNNRIRKIHFAGDPTYTLTNLGATNAGNYTVVITSPFGSVTSSVAVLYMPPFITAQPASQLAVAGNNPSFSVAVAGSGPFGYEWYFAGTNLVQSGTNSLFILPGVFMNNAGNYMVVVTNSYGSVTSQVATLTVVPSVITVQPTNQVAVAGNSPSFSVAVAGSGPFGYEWYFAGTNLIQSGTNSMLTLPGVSMNNAGNYMLVVTNSYGSVTSQVATLTVLSPPSVTVQPGSQTNLAGTTMVFSVAVAGTGPFTYQWQFNGTNFPNNIITTVAGNGNLGYNGDGGAATNASLNNPYGLAFDAFGNLYIADRLNNSIRKVATNSIITTVAGKGNAGLSGDGGAATNAWLDQPYGVAFDAFGNLYFSDRVNNRIRKVDTNGIITTVAGNSNAGYSGDGGAATKAGLHLPSGVAFDAFGNLYIADRGHECIRKVDTNGIITTVAGNGNAGYSGDGGAATNAGLNSPWFVACDVPGNLYISDQYNERIRRLATNGIITTVAGNGNAGYSGDGGAATNASLFLPSGVAFDVSGNLYIGDENNNVIRKVNFAGNPALTLNNIGTTNAGNYTVVITGPYGSVTSQVATLTVVLPPSLAIQPASQTNVPGTTVSFSVAVSGTGPFSYQWQFNGTNFRNNIITTVAGNGNLGYSGDGGAAINASLYYPEGVAFDAAGNFYIADEENNRIRKVDTNGIITTVAGNGEAGYSGDGGAATNASLYYPSSVAFDAFGNLYIADNNNNRIRRLATNGIITTVAGNVSAGHSGDGGAATNASLTNPSGVAFDAFGNLYIADHGNRRIRKVDTSGIITTVAGNGRPTYSGDGGAATNASLYNPSGVAFDVSGNLYIADYSNSRIRKVDTNGIITTVAGKSVNGFSGDGGAATNASLNNPSSVAFDASGNLYIADQNNQCVRNVDTNGIITTVAGNGSPTYSGDGGAATNASLYRPFGVAFDAAGNLYISDFINCRIRKVLLYAGYPTFTLNNIGVTNAGNYTVVITSPYGSVTSAVASLTVIVPPQIIASGASFGFTTDQSGFGFNISGVVGQTIVIDGSTNLLDWTPLFTNTANGTPAYFFDAASTNFPGRFYRARLSQ